MLLSVTYTVQCLSQFSVLPITVDLLHTIYTRV